jgi:hypothetical protein
VSTTLFAAVTAAGAALFAAGWSSIVCALGKCLLLVPLVSLLVQHCWLWMKRLMQHCLLLLPVEHCSLLVGAELFAAAVLFVALLDFVCC